MQGDTVLPVPVGVAAASSIAALADAPVRNLRATSPGPRPAHGAHAGSQAVRIELRGGRLTQRWPARALGIGSAGPGGGSAAASGDSGAHDFGRARLHNGRGGTLKPLPSFSQKSRSVSEQCGVPYDSCLRGTFLPKGPRVLGLRQRVLTPISTPFPPHPQTKQDPSRPIRPDRTATESQSRA